MGALALLLILALMPALPAFASSAVPGAYCSAQRAAVAGSVLVSAAQARASAQQFLLDVRTPGPFSDWAAGKVDAGTEADDLDGHPAVFVFRVTNKNGAYLGYLTVDAVRRPGPIVEFSRNRAPVFATMSDAESSLAASGRDGLAKRQVYLGALQYFLETVSPVSAAERYVRIAELGRPTATDPVRGPPPAETGSALAAVGSRYHVIPGVPDYQQFEYNYTSSEYNAGTVPAATGKYAVAPYLDSGSYASGCAPTSAANIIKYWAGRGYPLLDRGTLPARKPTNDPNSANPSAPPRSTFQKMINDLHVYFHTFYTEGGGGAAWPADYGPGMLRYVAEAGNYKFTAVPIGGFYWIDYAAEIQADRPVLLGFNGLKVYAPVEFDYEDHAVTGIGYDYTPGVTRSEYLIIHDNWPGQPSDVYVQFDGPNTDYSFRFMLAFAPAVPPANDDLASATTLTWSAGSVIGNNLSATRESGEPNHAGKPGGASVWYKWTPPTTGWYAFDTIGSTFDTLLNVYTGTSMSTLTSITSSDDISKNTFASRVGFYANSATTYRIAVDGYAGKGGAYQLTYYPLHSLSGTVRTASGAAVSGVTVKCSDGRSAVTNGSGVFIFLGLFDGTYTLTPVVKDGVGLSPGSLTAKVAGSDASGVAFVGQSNDDFASAIPLTHAAGTASGSSVGATRETDEPVYGGGASVWFNWTAPTSGRVWFQTRGSSYDTLLAVYSGSTLAGLQNVAWNDDYLAPSIKTSALVFDAVAGSTYRICIDGYQPSGGATKTGTYLLSWGPVAKAALTTPTLSTASPKHATYFTITGYVSPWFAGTVRVYLYKKVGSVYKVYPKSTSYVSRTVTTSGARVAYTYKVKLPTAGKWAVRTRYMGGLFATSNWSAYRYFTVK